MTLVICPQEFCSLVCWDDLTDEQKELFFIQEPDNTQEISLFVFNNELHSMGEVQMITDIGSTFYRMGFRGVLETSHEHGLVLRWIDEGATFFVAEYLGS